MVSETDIGSVLRKLTVQWKRHIDYVIIQITTIKYGKCSYGKGRVLEHLALLKFR